MWLGNANLISEQLSSDSPARESVEEIRAAATQARELCQQLLSYAGKNEPVFQVLRPSSFLSEAAQLVQMSLPRSSRLELDLPEDLPAVEGDTTQLRQVLVNLVTNASDALGAGGGVIRVRAGARVFGDEELEAVQPSGRVPSGRYLFFEVSDEGRGMDAATLERIFDPFFTTKSESGRGLGLAAVLGIVRAHGGGIRAMSAPGRGTSFRVLLPAVDAASPEEPEPARADRWEGSGTVLLVDDDRSVRSVAKRLLERIGFNVVTAETGRQGLAMFRQFSNSIACVVLDLSLPDIQGDEVYRQLRKFHPDVPVILSSGYGEDEVMQRLADTGPVAFLSKPYDLDTMSAELREALATAD